MKNKISLPSPFRSAFVYENSQVSKVGKTIFFLKKPSAATFYFKDYSTFLDLKANAKSVVSDWEGKALVR